MDIRESTRQILSRDKVAADLFYSVLLDRYPEVREYFLEI